MMRPQFEAWLAKMCLYYSNADWQIPENEDAVFRDVKHLDGQSLEFIGSFIRREYKFFPKSMSYAMHRGYEHWEIEQAKARKATEAQATELTEADMEANAKRTAYHVPRLLARLQGLNAKPSSWMTQPEKRS